VDGRRTAEPARTGETSAEGQQMLGELLRDCMWSVGTLCMYANKLAANRDRQCAAVEELGQWSARDGCITREETERRTWHNGGRQRPIERQEGIAKVEYTLPTRF
jgi:hypothetical protein